MPRLVKNGIPSALGYNNNIIYIYHTISYNNNGSKISAIIDRAFQHCSAFDVCRRLICKCSSNSRSAGSFVEGTANAGDRVHREHTETNKHMFSMYNHGWIKALLNKICSNYTGIDPR
jgi:hypothetical protein